MRRLTKDRKDQASAILSRLPAEKIADQRWPWGRKMRCPFAYSPRDSNQMSEIRRLTTKKFNNVYVFLRNMLKL